MSTKSITNNKKNYRREKGVTQEKLSELCNVAVGTIGNIECGRSKPSFEILVRISNALLVPIEDFFKSKDELCKKINEREKLSHYQVSLLSEEFKKAVFKSVSLVLENHEDKIGRDKKMKSSLNLFKITNFL